VAYQYVPPDFLQGQSADEIHRRMLNALPGDIDKSEAQIPWDFTRPAALEKAEFVQFELNETIKLMFPHWAYGYWLDLHAETVGLTRHPANRAYGALTVRGRPGIFLPQGFQFATVSGILPSVLFETLEDVTLNGAIVPDGQVETKVEIQALEGGTIGNVPPDTIIVMVRPITGITFITNPDATSGGTPVESDDALRERILDATRRGASFTGNDSDYVRWAKEVPSVGNVMVEPEWNGPGTVRLFIVDSNGTPANPQITGEVYDHIISPNNRMERLAPIGAALTVSAPAPLSVDITADIALEAGETFQTVYDRFLANLDSYWLEAATENSMRDVQSGLAQNFVRFVFVGAALANTAGLYDYQNLMINGQVDNIPIPLGAFPVTGAVALTEVRIP